MLTRKVAPSLGIKNKSTPEGYRKCGKVRSAPKEGMLRFAPQMPLRGMRTFRTSCKVAPSLGAPKEK